MSKSVPAADGYDWLLNKCVDADQAEHAGHLDDGKFVPVCFHCQNSEGRPRAENHDDSDDTAATAAQIDAQMPFIGGF